MRAYFQGCNFMNNEGGGGEDLGDKKNLVKGRRTGSLHIKLSMLQKENGPIKNFEHLS